MWNVPEPGEELGATRLPSRDIADCLPQSDVLCFELVPPASGGTVRLGRSSDNHVVINDATVSREHLVLGHDGERWWVEPVEGCARAEINGIPMDRAHRTPLVNGASLRIGDVALTFHTVDGFLTRIQGHAERLARMAESSPGTRAVNS